MLLVVTVFKESVAVFYFAEKLQEAFVYFHFSGVFLVSKGSNSNYSELIWIYISRSATIRSIEFLAWLGIEDLDLILKERRLHWYGHVERSNGAVKTAFDIQVNGKRGPGRPKMTWKQLTERDRREWKLSAIDPHDRDTWRSGVRSAMRAASQLPGRGPTVVDIAPIPAR